MQHLYAVIHLFGSVCTSYFVQSAVSTCMKSLLGSYTLIVLTTWVIANAIVPHIVGHLCTLWRGNNWEGGEYNMHVWWEMVLAQWTLIMRNALFTWEWIRACNNSVLKIKRLKYRSSWLWKSPYMTLLILI